MKAWIILASIVLCSWTVATEEVDETTLQLVQVLFRHGDRTPIVLFPNDPYTPYWERLGEGQLTPLGMREHYELGTYIRQRYANFIHNYTFDSVKVRSTDVDRTLMSAECNLAALFPPQGNQIWNTDLLWQPIPIHTVPLSTETLLKPDSGACPRYMQIVDEFGQSAETKKVLAQYKDLMALLTDKMGRPITRLQDLLDVFDLFKIETIYNFTLPAWVHENYDQLGKAGLIRFDFEWPDKESRRLTGGPLLGEMISNIEKKISKKDDNMKLYYYSAHDITVAAFLFNLDLFNEILPPYASTVLVEYHQTDAGKFVKMLYRNDSTHDPYPLILKGCTDLCPLKTFETLTKPLIPVNLTAECEVQEPTTKLGENLYIRNLIPNEKLVRYNRHH